MTPPAKKLIARLVFWPLFLAAMVVVGRHLWVKADPLRNHPVIAPWWLHHNYSKLSSTHRNTAFLAYVELERCYLTKWSAYDWVVWRVKENFWQKDDPPIHFRLERDGHRFSPASQPPSSQCRTVTDALMAMLHQEEFRRSSYAGDWRKWWEANWTNYPNRELKGVPSALEAPRSGRRR